MNTRVIHTKIWKDEFYAELSVSEKLLFIYLITNERISVAHCYQISNREIRFDTGLTDDQIEKAKSKFQEAQKIFFMNNWVVLKNASKYQKYEGTKNEEARRKVFALMNDTELEWYSVVSSEKYTPINTENVSIATPLKGSSNQQSTINNQKSEKGESAERGIAKSLTDNLPPDVIQELATKYQIPPETIEQYKTSYMSWIQEKPRDKNRQDRNMKATVENWISRDKKDGKLHIQHVEQDPEFTQVLAHYEHRMNTKLTNLSEQARYWNEMKTAGYTPKQVEIAIDEMLDTPFWKDNGFTFKQISKEIPKIRYKLMKGAS
jgi:hypothetical protein